MLKYLNGKIFQHSFCDYMKNNSSGLLVLPYAKDMVANLINFGLKGAAGGESLLNFSLSALSALLNVLFSTVVVKGKITVLFLS